MEITGILIDLRMRHTSTAVTEYQMYILSSEYPVDKYLLMNEQRVFSLYFEVTSATRGREISVESLIFYMREHCSEFIEEHLRRPSGTRNTIHDQNAAMNLYFYPDYTERDLVRFQYDAVTLHERLEFLRCLEEWKAKNQCLLTMAQEPQTGDQVMEVFLKKHSLRFGEMYRFTRVSLSSPEIKEVHFVTMTDERRRDIMSACFEKLWCHVTVSSSPSTDESGDIQCTFRSEGVSSHELPTSDVHSVSLRIREMEKQFLMVFVAGNDEKLVRKTLMKRSNSYSPVGESQWYRGYSKNNQTTEQSHWIIHAHQQSSDDVQKFLRSIQDVRLWEFFLGMSLTIQCPLMTVCRVFSGEPYVDQVFREHLVHGMMFRMHQKSAWPLYKPYTRSSLEREIIDSMITYEPRMKIMSTPSAYIDMFPDSVSHPLYQNVVSFDFEKFYPSLIVQFGIPHPLFDAKEVFREMMNQRQVVQRTLTELPGQQIIERVVKLQTVALYGAGGQESSSLYDYGFSRMIMAYGRKVISELMEHVKEKHAQTWKVLAVRTDSLFLHFTPSDDSSSMTVMAEQDIDLIQESISGFLRNSYEYLKCSVEYKFDRLLMRNVNNFVGSCRRKGLVLKGRSAKSLGEEQFKQLRGFWETMFECQLVVRKHEMYAEEWDTLKEHLGLQQTERIPEFMLAHYYYLWKKEEDTRKLQTSSSRYAKRARVDDDNMFTELRRQTAEQFYSEAVYSPVFQKNGRRPYRIHWENTLIVPAILAFDMIAPSLDTEQTEESDTTEDPAVCNSDEESDDRRKKPCTVGFRCGAFITQLPGRYIYNNPKYTQDE